MYFASPGNLDLVPLKTYLLLQFLSNLLDQGIKLKLIKFSRIAADQNFDLGLYFFANGIQTQTFERFPQHLLWQPIAKNYKPKSKF